MEYSPKSSPAEESKLPAHREQKPAYRQSRPPERKHRWLNVAILLCWDGLLLYMILRCLVHPVYGAVLVAGVSVYLGYQM